MNRSLPAFVLGSLVFALDQTTKRFVLESLTPGQPVRVIPGFLSLTLISNTGAAWGILQDYGFWLSALAFAALMVLLAMRRHFTHAGLVPRIAFGLLLGGVAGNLSDRLTYGHVVDFLSFYINKYHWPAFNVADSAICVGVGLYVLDSLWRRNSGGASGP
ncbi:MAG: signal peptidase II [Verrucomicrobia bacterium]|nr:signal peptidase II [Verrucomicrobiota bacterium]